MIEFSFAIPTVGDVEMTISALKAADDSTWCASRRVLPGRVQDCGRYVWTVTHIKSGRCLGEATLSLTQGQALSLAEYLDRSVGDFKGRPTSPTNRKRLAIALLAYPNASDVLGEYSREGLKEFAGAQ